MSINNMKINKRPIIYGEVLFDSFPDGSSVIGGAPFNVAWHLKGFGLDPLFISRVGKDKLGDKVIKSMTQWKMDISGMQFDKHYPTGVVEVNLDSKGKPLFNIISNSAYDYIDFEIIKNYLNNDNFYLIYHGSLIIREKASHKALKDLISYTSLPCFVDINLRSPWWSRFCVEELIMNSKWLKISDEELSIITEGLPSNNIKEKAKYLYYKYNLKSLIVTLGEKGSFIVGNDIIESDINKVNNIVDTVGAGDAFSSVVILGLIKNWTLPSILKRASEFASSICRIRGATNNDMNIYKSIIE